MKILHKLKYLLKILYKNRNNSRNPQSTMPDRLLTKLSSPPKYTKPLDLFLGYQYHTNSPGPIPIPIPNSGCSNPRCQNPSLQRTIQSAKPRRSAARRQLPSPPPAARPQQASPPPSIGRLPVGPAHPASPHRIVHAKRQIVVISPRHSPKENRQHVSQKTRNYVIVDRNDLQVRIWRL